MTIRRFKLHGVRLTGAATMKLTIDGNEVFDGEVYANTDPESYIADGSVDFDGRREEIVVPVTVEVSLGEIRVGPLSWNGAASPNELLTEEEKQAVISGTVTAEMNESIRQKGGGFVYDQDGFDIALDYEDYVETRSNIALNGKRISVKPHWYIDLKAGDVLQYDTVVYAYRVK